MIYTSYFANVKGVLGKKPDIRFCSIAGKTPDWFLELNEKLDLKSFTFGDLAPKYVWWREWHEKFKDDYESEDSVNWYKERYRKTVLDVLNPRSVTKSLYELSDRYDVCLLCYEKPEKFCHRHLVSEWLNDNGINCMEIT